MTQTPPGLIVSPVVQLQNAAGLHLRNATLIVQLAEKARAGVYLIHNSRSADAGSVIDMLTMGCGCGTRIQFGVEDPADTEIMEKILILVKNGFKRRV